MKNKLKNGEVLNLSITSDDIVKNVDRVEGIEGLLVPNSTLFDMLRKMYIDNDTTVTCIADRDLKFVKSNELQKIDTQLTKYAKATLTPSKFSCLVGFSKELFNSQKNMDNEIKQQMSVALVNTIEDIIFNGSTDIEPLNEVSTVVNSGVGDIQYSDESMKMLTKMPSCFRKDAIYIVSNKVFQQISNKLEYALTNEGEILYLLHGKLVFVSDKIKDGCGNEMFLVNLDKALVLALSNMDIEISNECGFSTDTVYIKGTNYIDMKHLFEDACITLNSLATTTTQSIGKIPTQSKVKTKSTKKKTKKVEE